MASQLSIFIALTIGFAHAFEIDHLVAVGNLVSKGKKIINAIKEGALWGLGHTSSIFIIGLLILLMKANISDHTFKLLEGAVGLMLISLGVYRMKESLITSNYRNHQREFHTHSHDKKLAYGVGVIHGLAGSGALILLVLSQSADIKEGLLYLLMFGIGSIAGMMVASGLFSLPFLGIFSKYKMIGFSFSMISAILCIYMGIDLAYSNFKL